MAIETVWSDIHHAFIIDAQGSIKVVKNIDAVITSVDNILRTHPGERVMLPEFGAGVNDLLFESMNQDLFDLYSDRIQKAIEEWDDRVNVTSVTVKMNQEVNEMMVKIAFTIVGYDNIFEHNVNLVGG